MKHTFFFFLIFNLFGGIPLHAQFQKDLLHLNFGTYLGYFDFGHKGNGFSLAVVYSKSSNVQYGLGYHYMNGRGYIKFQPSYPAGFYDPEKSNIYYSTGSTLYHKFGLFVRYLPFSGKIAPYFDIGVHFGYIRQHLYSINTFTYTDSGVDIKIQEDSGENGLTGGFEFSLGSRIRFRHFQFYLGATYGSTWENFTYTLFEGKIAIPIYKP